MTIHSGIALVLVLYFSFLFLYLDKFSVHHLGFFFCCFARMVVRILDKLFLQSQSKLHYLLPSAELR